MVSGDNAADADDTGVGGEGGGEERMGICRVISNPYELYSFTPAFEQVIND